MLDVRGALTRDLAVGRRLRPPGPIRASIVAPANLNDRTSLAAFAMADVADHRASHYRA